MSWNRIETVSINYWNSLVGIYTFERNPVIMRSYFLTWFIIIAFSGCGKKTLETNRGSTTLPNIVEFSDEQLKMAGVKTDYLQKKDISDIVECNGTIEVPPSNKVTVSPAMGGVVLFIDILPGNHVSKGETIATLEHPDYLKVQEAYIEASSQYYYRKEEYKRQGELTLEQATSLKKMQLAEADFKSLEARVYSLRKQLELLGIDPENLKAENISSKISVKSPLDGYVTKVFVSRGKNIEAREKLCEIVDKSHLHLQLNIFEKDQIFIKKGLGVQFQPAALPGKIYRATVELIGQSVDEENHSIPVHAHVIAANPELKPGMYITAQIICNPGLVYALPVTSLVRKENDFYVYIRQSDHFERVKINTGREVNRFMEIIPPDTLFLKNKFVTEGAYYLESVWEKNKE